MQISKKRVPLNLNIPTTLRDHLRLAIPPRQRSKFVTTAIEVALLENAKQQALALLDNLQLHDTNGQDSLEVLHGLRQAHQTHIAKRHKPL